jgi:hypothetical protein
MKSSRAVRRVAASASASGVFAICAKRPKLSVLHRSRCFAAHSAISRRASVRNAFGQTSSPGSGHKAAQMTARHAASGRRAHQMWSVEMCP